MGAAAALNTLHWRRSCRPFSPQVGPGEHTPPGDDRSVQGGASGVITSHRRSRGLTLRHLGVGEVETESGERCRGMTN